MKTLPKGASINGPNPTHRPIKGREKDFGTWLKENHPDFKPLSEFEEFDFIGGMVFPTLLTKTGKGKLKSAARKKVKQDELRKEYEEEFPEKIIGYQKLDLTKECDAAYVRVSKRRWKAKEQVLRHDLTIPTLNNTGINYRHIYEECGHIQLVPISNLYPWTKKEQNILEEAMKAIGWNITYSRIVGDSNSFNRKGKFKPGFGFRLY